MERDFAKNLALGLSSVVILIPVNKTLLLLFADLKTNLSVLEPQNLLELKVLGEIPYCEGLESLDSKYQGPRGKIEETTNNPGGFIESKTQTLASAAHEI